MPYGKPMLWPLVDPVEHKPEECYGCMNYKKGMRKADKHRKYVAPGNVHLPTSHDGIPVPKKNSPDFFSLATSGPETDFNADVASEYLPPTTSQQLKDPELIEKNELDALVAFLELGKVKSEKLASFLKRKNMLARGVNVTAFRHRDTDLKECFIVNAEKTSHIAMMSRNW